MRARKDISLRLLALTLVAVLLTACSSSSDSEPKTVGEGRVLFDSDVPDAEDAATRVAAAYNAEGAIPQNGSIGVYAYQHVNSTWAADFNNGAGSPKPDFMFNQKVQNTQPGSYYTYAPVKYWPNEENDKVSFIADYPFTGSENPADPENLANPSKTGITPLLTAENGGLPSYDFTVQDEQDKQVDFLVSKLLTDLPTSRDQLTVNDRVHFQMFHATSKVIVSMELDESLRQELANFEVTSLRLTNLKNSGRLSYSNGNTYAWSNQSGAVAYPFTLGQPQLLPQILDNTAEITLDYNLTFKTYGTVYQYEGVGTVKAVDGYTYSVTGASLALTNITPTATWQPNKIYRYRIRLSAKRIAFTAQVLEWGDEQDLNIDEWEM